VSADLLRRAAGLMRRDAEAALAEAPTRTDMPREYPEREAWQTYFAARIGGHVGKFAAFFHPAVALAGADWLDNEAGHFDATVRGLGVPESDAAGAYTYPLAFARAYLGEPT